MQEQLRNTGRSGEPTFPLCPSCEDLPGGDFASRRDLPQISRFDLKGDNMSESVEALLRRNLLEVFNERDRLRRHEALAEIWHAEGVLVNLDGRQVGRVEIDQAVEKLQAKFPGFVFTQRIAPEGFHGVGRIGWGFGPEGTAPVVTGIDVAEATAGKLRLLFAFVDQK